MDHLGHHHDHDHGHSHSHPHAGDEAVEELLSIFICSAFGTVAIMLGYQAMSGSGSMLGLLLVPQFFPWVFGGGVVLLLIALVRAISLWRMAGHLHGEDRDHNHEHKHAHGAAWRTTILIFPLTLFVLGLPNKNFSNERLRAILGGDIEISTDALRVVDSGKTISASFEDIANALRSDELMEEMTGNTVTVRGQLLKSNDRQFTLFTTKMTCCASDTVPLKAKIIVLSDATGGSLQSKGLNDYEWLEVRGVIQFIKLPDHNQPLPVIQAKLSDIQRTNPD